MHNIKFYEDLLIMSIILYNNIKMFIIDLVKVNFIQYLTEQHTYDSKKHYHITY